MNRQQPEPDADLRRLLHEVVEGVEPRPGLEAIRSRTRASSARGRRPWVWGAFAAAAATAAVVAGVAVLGGGDPRSTTDGPPAGQVTPSGSTPPSEAPTDGGTPDSGSTGGGPAGVAAPVYFAGDTARGAALYREFQRVDAADALRAAADLAVRGKAVDPDYRTLWPAGAAVSDAEYDGDVVRVSLSGTGLRERPASMTADEAGLAVQQVVYTVQGVAGRRAPVQLLLDGAPADTVLGVPASEPLANEPPLEVLAHVNITDPEQGEKVDGRLVATGVASSFEGTVPLRVLRGSTVVLEDFATAEGFADRLHPWTVSLDVSSLPPGDYTLEAATDDPSGGVEGAGPDVDTKEFTIP